MAKKTLQNNPKVLGLDVSTKTIGWALFDMRTQELLELTHVSPRPKIKTENKIEELLSKADVFKSKLEEYKNLGITKVIIEEPLLNSNNIYTVQTLLDIIRLLQKTFTMFWVWYLNSFQHTIQESLRFHNCYN